MKKLSLFLTVLAVSAIAFSCTSVRQNLYDEGGDTAKRLSDVLGRWQAATLDNALASANEGLKIWTEERGAYLVERTADGTVEDPFPQRTLDWYDNVLASIRADIKFLNALKKRAEEAGAKPLPPATQTSWHLAPEIDNGVIYHVGGHQWIVGERGDGELVVGKHSA